MAATTAPPPEGAAPAKPAVLARFDGTERTLHWVIAALFAVLLGTGAVLYFSALMAVIGRRALVVDVHLAAGLALPVPIALSVAGRWGTRLRADLRRFNRWSAQDQAWLRLSWQRRAVRLARRRRLVAGKFNAGQKLNVAFTGGAIAVMLLSGVVMYWFHPWPLSWRTGATDTHDWLAAAIVVVILGHISHALRDRDALRSMWCGTIPRAWAVLHAGGWLAELDAGAAESTPVSPGPVSPGPAGGAAPVSPGPAGGAAPVSPRPAEASAVVDGGRQAGGIPPKLGGGGAEREAVGHPTDVGDGASAGRLAPGVGVGPDTGQPVRALDEMLDQRP